MIEGLLKDFGFPIAVAVYFIYQNGKIEKAHKDDLKTLATNALTTLDKNTDALNKNSEVLDESNIRLRDARQRT